MEDDDEVEEWAPHIYHEIAVVIGGLVSLSPLLPHLTVDSTRSTLQTAADLLVWPTRVIEIDGSEDSLVQKSIHVRHKFDLITFLTPNCHYIY